MWELRHTEVDPLSTLTHQVAEYELEYSPSDILPPVFQPAV